MTQGSISSESTRPGRVIHLALTAGIFVYALVVELCESQLAPFEGFVPGVAILDALRVGFVGIGLACLAIALVILRSPHLVGSVSGAFMIAYGSLDAVAVLGLVLFLIGGNRLDFYGFAVPAIVGLLLLWTQAGRWDELVALEPRDLETTGEQYD